jgi:cellobiose phosphorylase
MGKHEVAWDLLEMINPLERDRSFDEIQLYKVEPYVVAADIYSKSPHAGRGGWTWYTGAAGWMYQLIIECLLGVIRKGEYLQFSPKLKSDWNSFSVQYRYKATCYHISATRSTMDRPKALFLDGMEQLSDTIRLVDDQQVHHVILNI